MPFEIVPPGLQIDFVKWWRVCAAASLLVLLVCAAAVPLRGIQLGVDFAGGILVQLQLPAQDVEEGGVRAALARAGIADASVIRLGDVSERRFQVEVPSRSGVTPDRFVPVFEAEFARSFGPASIEKVDFVGPRAGKDLRRDALVSLGIAIVLILAYVAFRFTPAFAPGAVVALVHDVLITAGVFVLFGWEFDLNVVAALLTIVGYSLNDTIVIYDRIRENLAHHTDLDLAGVINRSVNETLSRTILTSGTTLLSIFALLAVGGPQLRSFAGAMAIGVVVGTYSSVYVASPLVLAFEGRKSGSSAGGRRAAASTKKTGGPTPATGLR